jgi:hypothetical protein
VNLNQELVKQGWCWWYRKYAPGDTVFEGLENDAREVKKGLWVDPHPVRGIGGNLVERFVRVWEFLNQAVHGRTDLASP